MNLTSNQKLLLAAALVAGTIALRVMPHMPNFSAMTALSLFAVTFFGWRMQSFALIVATQLVGDLILASVHQDSEYAFHKTSLSTYGGLVLVGLLGYVLSKKLELARTCVLAVISSLVYWSVTNFHCWLTFEQYPKTAAGLYECYLGAIPFYRTTFMADVLFSLGFYVLALNLQSQSAVEEDRAY